MSLPWALLFALRWIIVGVLVGGLVFSVASLSKEMQPMRSRAMWLLTIVLWPLMLLALLVVVGLLLLLWTAGA